jgi:hypothetical protein
MTMKADIPSFATRWPYLSTLSCLRVLAIAVAFAVTCAASPVWAGFGRTGGIVEDVQIGEESAPLADPVTQMQAKVEAGKITLVFDKKFGYLPAFLKSLNIPVSSQTLIFSKSSLQRRYISTSKPRAMYFNDDVYIGYVQGGDLEFLSMDPVRGAIFSTLQQKPVTTPKITYTDSCLQCHQNGRTLGVPGPVVRSMFTEPSGRPIFRLGSADPDHTTTLSKRWGGWYVTGKHGSMSHRGNAVVTDIESEKLDRSNSLNITDLSSRFDVTNYMSPHSDIVALLTLDHQVYMHNVITRANFETRRALLHNKAMNKALEEPINQMRDSTRGRLDNIADAVVEALLFCDEAKLTDKVQGPTTFAKDFMARGPFDKTGRSLRQFDLKTRLFKFPCSFLIYSPSFDAIPIASRSRIFARLLAVLNGEVADEKYSHLSKADCNAIYEIIAATKKDLPVEWRKPLKSSQ